MYREKNRVHIRFGTTMVSGIWWGSWTVLLMNRRSTEFIIWGANINGNVLFILNSTFLLLVYREAIDFLLII